MNNQLDIFKFNFDSFHLCVWPVVQKVKFSLWVWWSLELKGFLPMCYSMKMWPCPKICYQAINTMAPPNLPSSAICSSALGNISFYSRYFDFYQISKDLEDCVKFNFINLCILNFLIQLKKTLQPHCLEPWNIQIGVVFFWMELRKMIWAKYKLKIRNLETEAEKQQLCLMFTLSYPTKTRWKSQQSMKGIVHHFSPTGFRKLPHTISTKTANIWQGAIWFCNALPWLE